MKKVNFILKRKKDMRRFKTQFNKRPVRDGHYPCDDWLPGDGTDPRLESHEQRRDVPNRKALQLCAQIFDTLVLTIPDFAEPILHNLIVDSVIPAPDSSQLLVTLLTTGDVEDAEMYLKEYHGRIRSEVAASIHRKRCPQLRFNVRRKNAG